MEETALEEDGALEGLETEVFPACLTSEGGLTIGLGGGSSNLRICVS